MLVPHEWILRYRAAITRNGTLPLTQQTLQVDVATLQEIIRLARPDIERDYGWGYQWGVVPEGTEFDALIEQAAADVRACRAAGEPETCPERYINRVPVRQKPKEEILEEQIAEREEKEDSPERKAQRASLMKRLRRRLRWRI